jgi:hypothetical protein
MCESVPFICPLLTVTMSTRGALMGGVWMHGCVQRSPPLHPRAAGNESLLTYSQEVPLPFLPNPATQVPPLPAGHVPPLPSNQIFLSASDYMKV